jgi:hypothetical protein
MEEVMLGAKQETEFEPFPADGTTEEFLGYTFHYRMIKGTKPWVMVYRTVSKARFPKPLYNVSFYNESQALGWIDRTKAHLKGIADFRATRKAERKAAPVIFKAGDVWYRSWGYDQTNVDFYQVTRVTPRGYFSRALQQTTVERGFMQGVTMPLEGQFRTESKEFFKVASPCDSKWEGREVFCSWYA